MKKVVKASSEASYAAIERLANRILSKMRDLYDELESSPSGFIDANDLDSLYTELGDSIRFLQYSVDDGTLAYDKDAYGIITKK